MARCARARVREPFADDRAPLEKRFGRLCRPGATLRRTIGYPEPRRLNRARKSRLRSGNCRPSRSGTRRIEADRRASQQAFGPTNAAELVLAPWPVLLVRA